MVSIRVYNGADWSAVWEIIEPVFRAGETYALDANITEDEAQRVWVDTPCRTYVAVDHSDQVLGTYYLKANQSGAGAHVCNCGYIVAAAAQKQGIATSMCQHSQQAAKEMGFRSMQFNLVVATNERAIALWKGLGYEVVGYLPEAFLHPRLGLVDALVMHKHLRPQAADDLEA